MPRAGAWLRELGACVHPKREKRRGVGEGRREKEEGFLALRRDAVK